MVKQGTPGQHLARRGSTPQRLARASARHPWRVLVAWGLVLVASVLTIGGLLGSALTTDASITTRPESVRADEVLTESFTSEDQVDEVVVIHSGSLSTDDPAFRRFVAEVRTSLVDTHA